MAVYYNENDPFAAQWLRNLIGAGLIARGDVDDRSILEVRGSDLKGYRQCHFFAGIGGWSYALRLAGWGDDREVWTGSCPCQNLSSAARGRNIAPDLWPAWLALIAANRPRALFGEQVAHKRAWLDRLCADLEPVGYEIGAAILPAVSVGKDHARHRIYFVGHANGNGESIMQVNGKVGWLQGANREPGSVARADGLSDRVGRLRAYGNAIVPQVAAEFIRAYDSTPS